MVRRGGVEPPRVAPYGPEPYASANSAISARKYYGTNASVYLKTAYLSICLDFISKL